MTHLGDDPALDERQRQGAELPRVSRGGQVVADDPAVALGDLRDISDHEPRLSVHTHLYHLIVAGLAGGAEGDVVAGEADDALDALLVGEDGDLVEDEVADAEAPAATAGRHVGGDPVAVDGKRGQHRGPGRGGELHEVRKGEVGEAGGLEGGDGEAEGVAAGEGEHGCGLVGMVVSYELYDDEAWDRGEAVFDAMRDALFNEELYHEIAAFVTKHRKGGRPMKFFPPKCGAFNFHYRIQYSDGKSAIIRFPLPGYFNVAEEKVLAEVATMRYIADHTTIPVPFILHYGMTDESPRGLGPFIVMEYIDHSGDVTDVLCTPGRASEEKPVLDPAIDEAKLEYMCEQIADIMIQLATCNFSTIGCLGMRDCDDNSEPDVASRPLSFNISQLGEVGGVPHFELPETSRTFSTSSAYYSALADMHLQQLSYQRNQAVRSADDCRRKYIARQLFRKAAVEHRIACPDTDAGPFKLWCDDLRPANILVDASHRIVGVIDWEFTYAAPAEFTYAPPWWLLLIMPEEWPEGLDDWAAKYEPRLDTFLRAMETKEREFMQQGRIDQSQALSAKMRRSWETGDFWLAYAARKSWAFDGIFWRTLDRRFFRDGGGDLKRRLDLLPLEQVNAIEGFVERKMQEKEEYTLVDWYADGAESKLPLNILKCIDLSV
ncbi:phosphotransferase family protein [Purpureocillium lavendulum]|uniref:Phosphotransferase family protein n=1 Tax=Purpureocillium lavendulum TaxID=1247861 RepID=A0AB34FP78_9HYPO|nr:phosphotransferase family protein [Purpureocillium lavendulum]